MVSDDMIEDRSRYYENFGCLVLALGPFAFIVSWLLAFREPLRGIPALCLVSVVGILLIRHLKRSSERREARRIGRLKAVASATGDAWRKLFIAFGLRAYIPELETSTRPALKLALRELGSLT
jgi:hypothetical protein